ncbi:hypothetical protein [Sphingomonas sp. 3-13AW]|uniref:hypothetical protein n=1 Tax=Sphingomonas sp. 3-13AW TaxID=3050450 RepID=UPI003BB62021
MEAALLGLVSWLDVIGLSQWARSTSWAYPTANTLHLLGLVMLVGGIGVVDLRLAGAWPKIPAAPLSRALTPLAIAGLLMLIATGLILFAADGKALAGSSTFHRKLVLIALALANAAVFRATWQKRVEAGEDLPLLVGRGMAVASLLVWLAVGTMGRLIAYS